MCTQVSFARGDQIEDPRAADCSENLGSDVGDEFGGFETPARD